MAGPLKGIKVLDLSRILAGPWSTQVLADYGAEVWKIERPVSGDDTRHWGPPYVGDVNGEASAESAYYISANRGKKSFEIDIATPSGQQTIRRLAQQADILVENFKVGGLKGYGLDYSSLRALNPGLIYCSITGFGQTGPYAERAGYDAMIQAMGGLMSITGEPDGNPGAGPQKVGVAVADLMTGMYAVSAILAALHHKNNTGHGQHIDLALLDTQVAWLANQGSNYLVSGNVPQRLGNAHPNIVPYQTFKAQDGYILLAVGNDNQFRKCCELMGLDELSQDARFVTNHQRVEHREVLIPIMQQRFIQESMQHWLDLLSSKHIPCSPINSLDKVFANEQIQHRQMVFDLEHPTTGTVPQVANPVRFSLTPIEYNSPAPVLGQHNEEIDKE